MVKNPPANVGDTGDAGSIPGSGRSPGVGNGNLLQYSYLGNTMDRGAWQATVHGSQSHDLVTKQHQTYFTTLTFFLSLNSISLGHTSHSILYCDPQSQKSKRAR